MVLYNSNALYVLYNDQNIFQVVPRSKVEKLEVTFKSVKHTSYVKYLAGGNL